MRIRIAYFTIILFIAGSCTQYEKDDTTPIPPAYIKIPMGITIKTELWNTIFDARQPGITRYKWKTNGMFPPSSNPDSPQVVAYDTGVYTVVFNDGQDSSKVIVVPQPRCFIPNSFTPDNTGPVSNNGWRPVLNCITTFNLKVFSKKNLLLFESNDVNTDGWDGKFNGKLCAGGYYYYYLKYTSYIGREYIKTGYFQLLL
jgi:gliding motility-associated-like protein